MLSMVEDYSRLPHDISVIISDMAEGEFENKEEYRDIWLVWAAVGVQFTMVGILTVLIFY
jgi:hypothetical protein